jgi:ABC-2 type transport system permease protein
MLRPYLAILSARFQLVLQYRAAAIAGFATQCWWGAMKILIFAAFFASSPAAAPMNLAQTVSYVWLGQAFLMFLPWYADPEVSEMVRTGAVAYERLRPVDAWTWWYARAVAWNAARAAPRALFMILTAAVLMPLVGLGHWGLRPPPGAQGLALAAASLIAAALLASTFTVILNVLVALTLTDRGVNTFAAPISIVLSGSLVPLSFFPAPIVPWMRLQPFAGLMDTPFRIWAGALAGLPAIGAIALQLAWTVALALVGRWLLEGAMSRIQVQGG